MWRTADVPCRIRSPSITPLLLRSCSGRSLDRCSSSIDAFRAMPVSGEPTPSYWRLQAWQLAGLSLGILAAKNVPEAAFAGPEWLWVAVGCGLGCFGLCLRWWAIRVLGTQFTRNLQVTADHQLVTNGPYRNLRHPSYTAAVLMFVGCRRRTCERLELCRLSCSPRGWLHPADPTRGGDVETGAGQTLR